MQELELVEAFGNSIDIDSGQDEFGSPERFGGWLAAHGFPSKAGEPAEAEWRLALDLRTALRDELAAHRDQDQARVTEARARIDACAAQIPLRATFHAGGAGLAAVDRGVAEMLGAVLAAMVAAHRDGTWHRLKMCQASTCDFVFYDRSKNLSKAWCSMRTCGNRNKTRSYRGRQRGVPIAGS